MTRPTVRQSDSKKSVFGIGPGLKFSRDAVSLYLNSCLEISAHKRPESTKLALRVSNVSQPRAEPKRNKRRGFSVMMSALINGVMGGVMGFLLSFLANYFVVPLPQSVTDNAIGNAISGLLSGFMGGLIGVLMHIRHEKKVSSKLLAGARGANGKS